ncbi:hypothetical protein L6452_02034 [Arctium lappa]|uniref:Uncharacterized protein n=1 Tax=Arctium lappa TaxID=4217 RepID=A0ACB9FIQ8_ARCLA|nr:hypothetical protein L6452_02034 [Arctium lappa]
MAGNPLTDKIGDINSRLEYAYRMALISKELFESTGIDCNGKYAEANSSICYACLILTKSTNGDHDMVVPHVDAGYKTTYARDNYSLAFVTLKGAGHTAPEFLREECFEMVKRWFAHKPI